MTAMALVAFHVDNLRGLERHIVIENVISTPFFAGLALYGLYGPDLPNPHVNPLFIRNLTALITATTVTKLSSFFWYVRPAREGSTVGPPCCQHTRGDLYMA